MSDPHIPSHFLRRFLFFSHNLFVRIQLEKGGHGKPLPCLLPHTYV